MTLEQLRRMRPPSAERIAFWQQAVDRARGRPPAEAPKRAVSIRLDPDVLAHFKQDGPGWQSRINAALRKQAKLKAK